MAADVTTLERAAADFEVRLRQVRDDQWSLPTPCSEWTVRELANHVVNGGRMASRLLDGATAAEVVASFDPDALGDDPVAAFEDSSAAEAGAFAEPGALDRIVHHPGAGDVPGAMLLGFRTGDNLLHAWDLARACGLDETLDADAVAATWAALEPMAPMIPSFGVFGSGPSGLVGADAPLQVRLLDLSGRRP
jgi:uncharacterized protein (TIGR03086 family)